MSHHTSPSVSVRLGDDPHEITTSQWSKDGTVHAVLHVGDRLALHATHASPEMLEALAHQLRQIAQVKRETAALPVAVPTMARVMPLNRKGE